MDNLLDRISSPADIKLLTKVQLNRLSHELRQEIIETVSRNGGHLGPNLGVVELTIALHYVFDSPTDKIIWDVGHQSYPHKLLTGRSKRFSSLRKFKGIGGYPSINESVHDAFGTGHSSTSISAALGMAVARDLSKQNHSIIAVIGDGALTGGMSFEALNHAGHLKKNIIVILNDNHISISKNIGALSSYLSGIVTNPKYSKIRKSVRDAIIGLPAVGEKAAESVGNIEDMLRSFSKAGLYFKALGFKYFGPINGHGLEGLIKAFRKIKKIRGPLLLHVDTKKGKGYGLAESDKERYHGVTPFNIENGENLSKGGKTTYTEAFSRAMINLAEKDSRIIGLTAAMPKGTGMDSFAQVFPDRYFDVGIAEQHCVTFAAGLARAGMKPVAAIYSTFLQRGYDQLIHDVCIQNLDVTFAIDRAGIVGEDSPTQNGAFDISYLCAIPNMVVMSPKDEDELGHMLKTAIEHNGPAAVRYPRGEGLGISIRNPYKKISIGKSETIRKAKDITLLSLGSCVSISEKAAIILGKKGISAEVINARFAKPLDEKSIISSVKKTGCLLTVEENSVKGGFGNHVLGMLSRNDIMVKAKCIGMPDKFISHGPAQFLRERIGLTPENIARQAKALVW